MSAHQYPKLFAIFYRQFFNPTLDWERPIAYNNRLYGVLTVSLGTEMAIARAWENIRHLLALSTLTIAAVCLLVYLAISRALRPAQAIVAGLNRLRTGDLDYRLSAFELLEWRQIAAAINQLADQQQQLLDERQKLALMLMNLQEEERRYLARELHDELGQCLTAIHAVAAGMTQAAKQPFPALAQDAEQISRFTQTMQRSVRALLTRLRPAELDELGLAASLRSLLMRWNLLSDTHYSLQIEGDCARLPEPLVISLFRLIQEAISNIAKHASADRADISLLITADEASLIIRDDGVANSLPFANAPGIGLLGMRERVLALKGQFSLSIAGPHGLEIQVCLPLNAA